MELAMNGFKEMNEKEMMDVDGGFIITGIIIGAVVGAKIAAKGAVIAGVVKGGIAGGGAGVLLDAASRRPNHVLTPILEPIANWVP